MSHDIDFAPVTVPTPLGDVSVTLVENDDGTDLVPSVSVLETTVCGHRVGIRFDVEAGIRVPRARRGNGYGMAPAIAFTNPDRQGSTLGEVETEYGRVTGSYSRTDSQEPGETPFERGMRERVEQLFADPGFEDRLNAAIADAERAALLHRSGELRRQAEDLAREADALEADASSIPGMRP
jgi:hypothetical protein